VGFVFRGQSLECFLKSAIDAQPAKSPNVITGVKSRTVKQELLKQYSAARLDEVAPPAAGCGSNPSGRPDVVRVAGGFDVEVMAETGRSRYAVSDVINQLGLRWLRTSLRIAEDATYEGSLLSTLLRRTAWCSDSADKWRKCRAADEAALPEDLANRMVPLAGGACPAKSVVLPPPGVMFSELCEMLRAVWCPPATGPAFSNKTLVVHVRNGEIMLNPHHVGEAISHFLATKSEIELIELNVVMVFLYVEPSDRRLYKNFTTTTLSMTNRNQTLNAACTALDSLIAGLAHGSSRGLGRHNDPRASSGSRINVAVRSSRDVDADVCHFLRAANFLPVQGGFGRTILRARSECLRAPAANASLHKRRTTICQPIGKKRLSPAPGDSAATPGSSSDRGDASAIVTSPQPWRPALASTGAQ
jgi:hypothetical protein